MANRLEGKVAVVTGAGSGIGRAGAAAMAAEGARVVIAEIDPERGERVAAQITGDGGEAVADVVDVTDAAAVEALVARTVERWGSLDVLFHCAVDVPFVNNEDGRLTELPDEVWQRMLDLVLTGTFNCAKHAGRRMIEQGSGSIILTATTDALIGCAGLDAYTAAKGGVVALTRSFAAGIARDGVRVNAICPSFVSSEPQREWLANEDSRPRGRRAAPAAGAEPGADRAAGRLPRLRRGGGDDRGGDPDRQRLHGVQGQPRHRRRDAGRPARRADGEGRHRLDGPPTAAWSSRPTG